MLRPASCEVRTVKCPTDFDFFCPIENRKDENGQREYYVHVPAWLWRAMRKKYPGGFVRVHFGKGFPYNGYTFKEHKKLEKEIQAYADSREYRRLRKKMQREEREVQLKQ